MNRQWESLVSVPAPPGYAHPTEPQCSYDPVDGLTLAPDIMPLDKIRQLEEENAQLKSRLYDMQLQPPRGASPNQRMNSSSPNSESGGISLPRASLSVMNMISPSQENHPDLLRLPNGSASPELRSASTTADPFMDLLFSVSSIFLFNMRGPVIYLLLQGWDPDLPPPDSLFH